jgi:hypothetical protein
MHSSVAFVVVAWVILLHAVESWSMSGYKFNLTRVARRPFRPRKHVSGGLKYDNVLSSDVPVLNDGE